jgi:hypothetical protein
MSTYIRFDSSDIVTSNDQVITSTWSGNTNNLTTIYTSSNQYVLTNANSQGQFFLDVYSDNPDTSTSASLELAIAYGNRKGSGSVNFTEGDSDADGYSAARSIYGQYRTLVYGDENTDFQFGNYTGSDDFFVVNVDRSRYKEHLKTGFNITLKNGANELALTDDSGFNAGASTLTNVGRQFNIISGTNGAMYSNSETSINLTDSGSYGYFYPDAGFMIFNADALRNKSIITYTAQTGSSATQATTDRTGSFEFFTAVSESLVGGGSFELDSVENLNAQYLFARVKNQEFNYSTNPSFIDDEGNLRFTSMISQPTTYITTVGLYNDNNELLAVAKLSQPLPKDFTRESLIRIKLDY